MEIHPPEHPILTWKEFLVHIGTVTIGILIALSLEGLVEWNHHRHLIREARENIRTELEDNRREMTAHLSVTAKNRADHESILKWIAEVERDHKSSIHSLAVGANRADLNNTSWTTAQAVGALGLMDYAEVKRDAEVYQLQEEFLRLQTRAEDATIAAMVPFTSYPDDPAKMSRGELEDERNRIQNSITALVAQDQVGRELQKRYEARLQDK
jgi:hypothetical protein